MARALGSRSSWGSCSPPWRAGPRRARRRSPGAPTPAGPPPDRRRRPAGVPGVPARVRPRRRPPRWPALRGPVAPPAAPPAPEPPRTRRTAGPLASRSALLLVAPSRPCCCSGAAAGWWPIGRRTTGRGPRLPAPVEPAAGELPDAGGGRRDGDAADLPGDRPRAPRRRRDGGLPRVGSPWDGPGGPSWSCRRSTACATTAPGDPAAAGCTRTVPEYAELAAPGLEVTDATGSGSRGPSPRPSGRTARRRCRPAGSTRWRSRRTAGRQPGRGQRPARAGSSWAARVGPRRGTQRDHRRRRLTSGPSPRRVGQRPPASPSPDEPADVGPAPPRQAVVAVDQREQGRRGGRRRRGHRELHLPMAACRRAAARRKTRSRAPGTRGRRCGQPPFEHAGVPAAQHRPEPTSSSPSTGPVLRALAGGPSGSRAAGPAPSGHPAGGRSARIVEGRRSVPSRSRTPGGEPLRRPAGRGRAAGGRAAGGHRPGVAAEHGDEVCRPPAAEGQERRGCRRPCRTASTTTATGRDPERAPPLLGRGRR